MQYKLKFTTEAKEVLKTLKIHDPKKHKKVLKTLGLMEVNLRHPSLKTHEYDSLQGPNKEKAFEAYVENKTPAAYRIFWYSGPEQDEITILTITPHP
ncbi:hypothetical protein H6G54_18130 [Anabaena cylindrica FACHB-243]|uniref:Plasmid stabilization system n=1 Tax=Anabaena cylindrica (strain ATCC 27899 / PCC 7122) TaxID=272123 RepID=K9Z9Z1_ANACC|nr:MULTISPECIES: hypothetical protein [Anabaena]AFZ55996.1 hypothetical protein Anacy_0394 [Anabaena cylindrica PCC 7122]MBD2419586.1 hypothetical protein [Anabaena cylindrica FACHB-243]MBY5282845.1 hypothetical protein [Anabaena sp. CCAP 1446/1C]MBY5306929.1 hypothetical protein [Anabaena sp. CCAP 1446/1C]MCM2407983.1 hypothetical protein [Anabaena sp. CCAP 1446/1C]